ncbi:MAG: MadR family response regulator transcription factor [Streptosporangiaceae bacterium]
MASGNARAATAPPATAPAAGPRTAAARSAPGPASAGPPPASPPPGALVQIVLVDDHAILRQGLRALLGREPDLEVVGEASSAAEAMAVVERSRPAIVLLDMKLSPESDSEGLALCARLTRGYPGLSVLVLSTFVDDALVVSAIQHGACGYVIKDVDTAELVRAIRLVARNGSAFDSRSAAAMVRSIHAPQARSPLTDRELSVLRLVAGGLSNRGIGARLHLSETTVKFHVRNIMRKLEATSRAEAVYKATRSGLDLTSG